MSGWALQGGAPSPYGSAPKLTQVPFSWGRHRARGEGHLQSQGARRDHHHRDLWGKGQQNFQSVGGPGPCPLRWGVSGDSAWGCDSQTPSRGGGGGGGAGAQG